MRYIVTIIILLLSLYGAVAGYVGAKSLQQDAVRDSTTSKNTIEYHGNTFQSVKDLFAFIDHERDRRFFGWIFTIPESIVLLVGALAAGLFGGALRVLILAKTSRPAFPQVLGEPIVGLGIAVVLFLFSLTVPSVFSTGPILPSPKMVRPETVLLFCACGGIFSENAYHWIEGLMNRYVFNTKTTPPSGAGH
jgi:hypothetical protein